MILADRSTAFGLPVMKSLAELAGMAYIAARCVVSDSRASPARFTEDAPSRFEIDRAPAR
jgi:hypothetical protein